VDLGGLAERDHSPNGAVLARAGRDRDSHLLRVAWRPGGDGVQCRLGAEALRDRRIEDRVTAALRAAPDVGAALLGDVRQSLGAGLGCAWHIDLNELPTRQELVDTRGVQFEAQLVHDERQRGTAGTTASHYQESSHSVSFPERVERIWVIARGTLRVCGTALRPKVRSGAEPRAGRTAPARSGALKRIMRHWHTGTRLAERRNPLSRFAMCRSQPRLHSTQPQPVEQLG